MAKDQDEGDEGSQLVVRVERPLPAFRPPQPVPLAFLHRVVQEHRARLGRNPPPGPLPAPAPAQAAPPTPKPDEPDAHRAQEEEPWYAAVKRAPQVQSAGIIFSEREKEKGGSPRASRVGSRVASPLPTPQSPHPSSLKRSMSPAVTMRLRNSTVSSSEPSSPLHPHPPTPPHPLPRLLPARASSTSPSLQERRLPLLGPIPSSEDQPAVPPPPPPPEVWDEPVQPPENFSMVSSWVYRSSFPSRRHFRFLSGLGLRSVLTLVLETYPEGHAQFLRQEGISLMQFGLPGNKEPFVHVPPGQIAAALAALLDRRNHPILVHCNKGKHRTGCLMGCLRKMQQWSLTAIFEEYRRFASPKPRAMDQEFIELFDTRLVWAAVGDNVKWLPHWAVLPLPPPQLCRSPSLSEEEEEEEPGMRLERGM